MKAMYFIALAAGREQIRNWPVMLGRISFLIFVLILFSQLWQAIAAERNWNIAPDLMLWYLAITEVVIMSLPRISQSIEHDLRTDRITNRLVRPLGYFRQKFSQFVGEALVNMAVIFIVATLSAYALTGTVAIKLYYLPIVILCLLLGILMALIQLYIIGLTTIWLKDSTPITWLYQKLQFVLGGLMIPITFYPEFLAKFCHATPFASMIYGPGSLLFDMSANHVSRLIIEQLLWITFSIIILWALGRYTVHRLILTGG